MDAPDHEISRDSFLESRIASNCYVTGEQTVYHPMTTMSGQSILPARGTTANIRELPKPIYIPWDAQRHVQYLRYLDVMTEEVSRLELARDTAELSRLKDCAGMGLFGYHYASFERMRISNDFNRWLFSLDDKYDANPQLGRDPVAVEQTMSRYFEVLKTGILSDLPDPFERYSVALRQRLLQVMSPRWWERFIRDVHNYLFLGSMEAVNAWAHRVVPTVEFYRERRCYDSAMHAVIDVVECATEVEWHSIDELAPELKEMREIVVRHVAFLNDVFSYPKEVIECQNPWNLAHVLMTHEQCSMRDAFATIVDELNDSIGAFVDLEATVCSKRHGKVRPEDARVDRYVEGLKSWIAGNYFFSIESKRYGRWDAPRTVSRP
jgi:5-epi-alpha-selinene synthase